MRHILILIVVLGLGCGSKISDKANPGAINNNTSTRSKTQNILSQIELLSNTKSIGDVTYAIHSISNKDISKLLSPRFDGENNSYEGFSCFFMDVSVKGERDIANFNSPMYRNLSERVEYLSFLIKDFVHIKGTKMDYYCINSTFERSYGQLPYARFFLVFNKIEESDLIFQFNDNYFNNGLINLKL